MRSIAWLEFILAGVQLFFGVWASQFLDTIFQIEVPLPTGLFVIVPALIFFIVFLCDSIEKSSNVELSRGDASTLVVTVKKIRTIKITRKIDEIHQVVLRPFRFGIESGIVAGFQVLIGLGLSFHGYELLDVGAFTQGTPFLAYGIFSLASVVAWLFVPPREVLVTFEDKSRVSLRVYSYTRKQQEKVRGFFLGRDAPSNNDHVDASWKGLAFLGALAALFCINHFTFAFAYQVVDSIALLLVLAFLRRAWLYIKQPTTIMEIDTHQEGMAFSVKNTGIKSLDEILFPKQIRAKEWFLWSFLAYEIGWKFWYTMALLGIDASLWNPTITLIIAGYAICIITCSLRFLPSSSKKYPLLKWIVYGIILLLPLTAILSATGIWTFELSILGIKVVF